MRDALILSDLHLGADNCQADSILRFLEGVRHGEAGLTTRCLILNGDVFDSYDMRRLEKSHWKILSTLRKLTKNTEVHWLTGNHDHSADLLSHLLGVEVHDELVLRSGDARILCLHGHAFDSFLDKHPILTTLADGAYNLLQWLDPSHSIARFAKKSSKVFLRCADKIRSQAISHALRSGCEVVCCGHTHLAEDYLDAPTGVRYYNSGSWTEKPCHYLAVSHGRVQLLDFAEETGQGFLEIAPEQAEQLQIAKTRMISM